jgi:prepilin-type N-terminal cleavage/methylation domain-containing protein
MKRFYKVKKGFTLVEMVIVIAIIVILSVVLFLSVSSYLSKAQTAKSKLSTHNEEIYKASSAVKSEIGA